jgi:hypothetical protein
VAAAVAAAARKKAEEEAFVAAAKKLAEEDAAAAAAAAAAKKKAEEEVLVEAAKKHAEEEAAAAAAATHNEDRTEMDIEFLAVQGSTVAVSKTKNRVTRAAPSRENAVIGSGFPLVSGHDSVVTCTDFATNDLGRSRKEQEEADKNALAAKTQGGEDRLKREEQEVRKGAKSKEVTLDAKRQVCETSKRQEARIREEIAQFQGRVRVTAGAAISPVILSASFAASVTLLSLIGCSAYLLSPNTTSQIYCGIFTPLLSTPTAAAAVVTHGSVALVSAVFLEQHRSTQDMAPATPAVVMSAFLFFLGFVWFALRYLSVDLSLSLSPPPPPPHSLTPSIPPSLVAFLLSFSCSFSFSLPSPVTLSRDFNLPARHTYLNNRFMAKVLHEDC